ncbi:hypothetical protein HCN44_004228 [Aphidius gifuensis]|uniref:MIF4G domain-containing protein n=2 Tax=Aphidius gifuensis TaxID=684658 RepID=A0A834Y1A9_APHGI|nr:polyadenylate-binding protein-interacting protein 1 isoform X1 [Aphidius gifuensis]KAF7994756.1 hypothetical protein HCN44_004228 [Aphidius gifuensis]
MEHVGDGDGGGDRRGSSGRGRGRVGWPNDQHQQLRRPLNTSVNQQTAAVNEMNEMFSGVAMNDGAKKFELSAEAAEFVPRSFVPSQGVQQQQKQSWQRSSVQERLNVSRNQGQQHYGNHQQQQQYPYHVQQQMQYHHYGDSDNASQSYQRYEGGYDKNQGNRNSQNNRGEMDLPNLMAQLTTAMNTLTRNPDQFENLVVPLVCNIAPHLKVQASTIEIIDAIMQKCILDSNFRYSGARLCCHLDAADQSDNHSTFRTALFERCKEEQEIQKKVWPSLTEHTPDDEKKCHGLIMTLAELVAQMDSTGSGSALGKLLLELISITLKNPGPNSAKLICQSLKLAGQFLERDSTTNRQEIERVMHELTELVTNGRVDVHVGRMVNSVCELRTSNWGRIVSSHGPTPVDINQTNTQNQDNQNNQQFDEPVFYGPDGMVLSAEERRFCQDLANMDGDDGVVYGDMMAGQLDEDEEDDMIAAAYEEFLKMPPNNKAA